MKMRFLIMYTYKNVDPVIFTFEGTIDEAKEHLSNDDLEFPWREGETAHIYKLSDVPFGTSSISEPMDLITVGWKDGSIEWSS